MSEHGGSRREETPFEIKATGEQARNYDFINARGPQKTTNVIESIGHLVKGCLGGGVVAMHEAYMTCGLWTALGMNIFLGFAVSYCVHILVRSAQVMYGRIQEPVLSYPDLAQASLAVGPFPRLKRFQKLFRYAVDFTIGVDLFGSCCVYQVIIARTLKQLVEGTQEVVEEAVGSSPNVRVYILTLLIPCVLICMILQLKYLAPFSIVADIFIITVAGATIAYAMTLAKKPLSEFPAFKSVLGLFEFMGMCVFSMEGVGVSMAIENHMTNPKKFPVVLVGGMGIVVSIVMVIGFFGYYGFGETAMSPVTVNFPLEPFPVVLKVFMALMIYVTFALNFWVPFDLVWFYLRQRHPVEKHWYWQRIYRAIAIVLITIIAFIFPNVGNFVGLLGSFCLSNMGFIYPAFIELTIVWTDPGLGFMKWRLWKCVIICLFGTVLCIVGTYTNAKGLVQSVNFSL